MFEQPDLDYAAQMQAYVTQRQAKRHKPRGVQPSISAERAAWRNRLEELRVQRRRQRWAAQASDRDWQQVRQAHRQQKAAWRALSGPEKRRCSAEHKAVEAQWRQDRLRRRAERADRRKADLAWRQARQALLCEEAQAKATLPPALVWIALLVIVDNCTRRCVGLASFAAGVHVTAESVVDALRQLLPADLQFVISDNGSQFRSDAFAALANAARFIHVRIAPYRARTNGIAERFVRTLKERLEQRTWAGPDDMPLILTEVQADYNDCPHQGRELAGLSPNEYDRRLRLGAIC